LAIDPWPPKIMFQLFL